MVWFMRLYIYELHIWNTCWLTSFFGKVEFLNSVIVDIQRKNEDLKSKLEKMAEAALNGNGATEMDSHNRYFVFKSQHTIPRMSWIHFFLFNLQT